MTTRVLLVSPALGVALRQGRFDDGTPLDAKGRAQAEAAAGLLPPADMVVVSATTRCRETAQSLGFGGPLTAPAELAPLDMGRWRGRTLDEVAADAPEDLARWLSDPRSAAPSGESVTELCTRVASWLDAARAEDGRVVAVVEPEIVRAAAVHAIGAAPMAFWRLDVPPLTVTELSGRTGRWNVRLGRPLSGP
ncbi:histidine phosphatase family protein [Streptomyces sp. NPDC001020]